MEQGMVHLYYGGGKGKTTAAIGLAVRAAGHGYRVLFYQFMKDNSSGERSILGKIPGIRILDGMEEEKFSRHMTALEKLQRRKYYEEQFRILVRTAEKEKYDLLILDEIICAIHNGMFTEKLLLKYLKSRNRTMEIVLTGNYPSIQMEEMADYISNIHNERHPFDKGILARKGIEC